MDAGLKRDVPSFEDSGGEFSVVKDLISLLYAKRKKSQAAYAKSADGGDMTTTNIIGVVVLVGGVLGYGALFLWVLTEDKRKERKEEKKCTKASIIVTIAASGWTRGVIMSRRRLGLKEI